ncbi:hypothetical protein [Nicoliella lavandulae]|uniref:Extracellular protein n=1 Tax=Nicoliella lavandulae TaxID=3082954 RepID=A0ABU8SJP8_9LACO
MNKWVRIGAISAVTMGMLVLGYRSDIKVSAAEQFYSVPTTNTNIQQESNATNGMSDFSDDRIQNVNTVAPAVQPPAKYVRTSLSVTADNPANTYTSRDGSNTFSTYYYLPEGFHVKNTEHGNYQSSVQVGDNIYLVESMGTGTNQGAIVRYNLNDLKQLGVITDSGEGRDLVWKALKYVSPYTKTGNTHSAQYNNYNTYMQNAVNQLNASQSSVKAAQDQSKSDQEEVDDYQKTLDNTMQKLNVYVSQVQKEINAQYKQDKKMKKQVTKPDKLTIDNFTDYFNSLNDDYSKKIQKNTDKQSQVKQQIQDLKLIYAGKKIKSADDTSDSSAASDATTSDAASSASDSSSKAASASADATSDAKTSKAASKDAKSDNQSSKADSKDTKSDSQTKKSDDSQDQTTKKMTKQQYTKKLASLQKKLANLKSQKTDYKTAKATGLNYIKTFTNNKYYKKMATDKQNVSDAKDLVDQDNEDIESAQQDVVTAQKAIDNLKQNQVDYGKYSAIAHVAQISPLINIGHGQTLSYNYVTKNLYLAQDDSGGDLGTNDYNVVTELDSNSLQPIKQFNFQLWHDNKNYGLHTLTFDSQGNAYFGRKSGSKYQIFKGTFDENSGQVSFAPVPQTINWGGKHNQGLTYNPVNNRLYIVSDDIITSVPADKLGAGTVDPSDVHYLAFNSGREFEDITFDSQGYGYLLSLWKPEILKSSNPMN